MAHSAVIDARAKEARGNGTAAATVRAQLRAEDGATTRVDVITELDITGRPAQFGRGVMADVGSRIIGQFAEALAREMADGAAADGAAAASGGRPAQEAAEPGSAVDLVGVAGPAVMKRVVPMVAVALILLVLARRVIRRAPRAR